MNDSADLRCAMKHKSAIDGELGESDTVESRSREKRERGKTMENSQREPSMQVVSNPPRRL